MFDQIIICDYQKKMTADRFVALSYIFHFIGKPYIWGGDNPLTGFDCSGLSVEYCKSGGVLANTADYSAAGLHGLFKPVLKPYAGCLAYYENDNHQIIHVSICINERLTITAGGGGSSTISIQDAIRQDAFVKIRDLNYRKGLCGFNDPFFERSPI